MFNPEFTATAGTLDAAMAALFTTVNAFASPDAIKRAREHCDSILDAIERTPAKSISDVITKAKAAKAFYPACDALDLDPTAPQPIRLAAQIIEALAAMPDADAKQAAPAQVRAHMEQRALYRLREAAEVLAIGRTKLYELIAEGKLEVVKIGKATRITAASLARFSAATA